MKDGDQDVRPQKLKAVYSIEISRKLYEEIRINEEWDKNNMPRHSDRYEEGYIWSELYGQSQEDPFEKWAYNYHMSVLGGTGTPESFFENHFAKEKIRRKGLLFSYPDQDSSLSQEEHWKKDPRISWLYYKRSFDAVFPVLCEMGKTQLVMEFEGTLDDGRPCRFVYTSRKCGELFVDGKKLVNLGFFDERYRGREKQEALGTGRPEKCKEADDVVMIYGVHSLSQLFEGLETAARRALFYAENTGGDGKKRVYRINTLFGKDIIAKRTDMQEEDLRAAGAEKLKSPEVDGKRIALFYWNYDRSVESLGGYAEQAFCPDMYRLKKQEEDEYYLALDELEELEGWYPLNRFSWEDDPEPEKEADLRKIIMDVL